MPTQHNRVLIADDDRSNLKSNSKTREISVIVLSGSIDERDEEGMLALGAAEFLKKPVDPEYLDARLRHWLEIAQPQSAET
jgi:DNA-binding response OmpR family regulator